MWILTGGIFYWHAIRKIDTSKEPYTVYYLDGTQETLTEGQSRELAGAIRGMSQHKQGSSLYSV